MGRQGDIEGDGLISEFYYGTTWRWPVPFLPRIMLSASYTRTIKHPWIINKPWMMDSGIGGMFKPGSQSRLTVDEYAEQIRKWNPPIAWSYDYPCEPSIRKRFGYSSVEAQLLTNKNTVYLRDKCELENVFSVVQGWKLSDYLTNIDKLKETGLITERMGIGSICRRGQTIEINRIIRNVKRNLPGWVKLHGFGVKISILNSEGRYNLESTDSISWNIDRRYYMWNNNNNRGLTWHDKVPHLLEYVNRIEAIINKPMPITIEQVME